MKKSMKKMLALVVSIAILLGLIPATVTAQGTPQTTPTRTEKLYIDRSTESTSNEAEGWSWDKDARTLTLEDGAYIKADDDTAVTVLISSEGNEVIKVILKGDVILESTVKSALSAQPKVRISDESPNHNASLTLIAPTSYDAGGFITDTSGIYTRKEATVDIGGDLHITAGRAVAINNGECTLRAGGDITLNALGEGLYYVNTNNVTIESTGGGNITLGNENGSCELYGYSTTVKTNGGDITINAYVNPGAYTTLDAGETGVINVSDRIKSSFSVTLTGAEINVAGGVTVQKNDGTPGELIVNGQAVTLDENNSTGPDFTYSSDPLVGRLMAEVFPDPVFRTYIYQNVLGNFGFNPENGYLLTSEDMKKIRSYEEISLSYTTGIESVEGIREFTALTIFGSGNNMRITGTLDLSGLPRLKGVFLGGPNNISQITKLDVTGGDIEKLATTPVNTTAGYGIRGYQYITLPQESIGGKYGVKLPDGATAPRHISSYGSYDETNHAIVWSDRARVPNNFYYYYKATGIEADHAGIYVGVTVQKEPVYTLTFDADGGSPVLTAQTLEAGESPAAVTDPTKDGFRFLGWYDGDTKVTLSDYEMPAGDKTLTAKWEAVYTVSVTNGADRTNSGPYAQGAQVSITAAAPPAGYVFDQWVVTGSGSVNPVNQANAVFTVGTGNATVEAAYKDVERPAGEITVAENSWRSFLNTITFGLFFRETQNVTIAASDNSGETVAIDYFVSEDDLGLDTVQGKADGWSAYNTAFTLDPDRSAIVYVRLTDGAGNKTYLRSNVLVLDATDPIIAGITDGETYTQAKDVTVTDPWLDSVTLNSAEQTVTDGQSAFTLTENGVYTIVATDKSGNETSCIVTIEMPPASYALTFYTDGGSPVPATQTLAAGAHPTAVADPAKDGFTFLGWYDGDAKVTLSDYAMPEGNKTLTAKWEAVEISPTTYTLTFNTDGGTPAPDEQTLEIGAHPTAVADPAKDGFAFLGWYDGDAKVTLSDYAMSEGNKTLTAKWEKIEENSPVTEKPGQDEKPSVTENPDNTESPVTGNSSNPWISLVVAGMSLSTMICLIRKKRKEQQA